MGALYRNRLSPFLFICVALLMSVYVSIWCNCIVVYLLGHMAIELLQLRAKERMYEEGREGTCPYSKYECVCVCVYCM